MTPNNSGDSKEHDYDFHSLSVSRFPGGSENKATDDNLEHDFTGLKLPEHRFRLALANSAVNVLGQNVKNESPTDDAITAHSQNWNFPYRFQFPYVSKEKSGNNDRKSDALDDTILKHANGDLRLQRRNRSRRDTLTLEASSVPQNSEEKIEVELPIERGDIETGASLMENQQHKSDESETEPELVSSVQEDELAEANVKDGGITRPSGPSNTIQAIAALDRLNNLLQKMLQELSMFERFTLRLIRMTERQDIEQMSEIMKDFEISNQKPIFFIAGGLRKLRGSVILKGDTLPVAANLTDNVSSNETELDSEPTTELPPSNTTPDVSSDTAELNPVPTLFPILRPSSTLPVEDDVDDDDGETTTETLDPKATESSESSDFDEPTNITSVSSLQSILRQKRNADESDIFIWDLPMPGRQARTENPYDEEEVFEPFYELLLRESIDSEPREHLPPQVPNSFPSSPLIPTQVIDQSHTGKNDEISLNDFEAISGQAKSNEESDAIPVTKSSEKSAIAPFPPFSYATVSDVSGNVVAVVPQTDYVATHDPMMETGESNDHLLQGEKSIETDTEIVGDQSVANSQKDGVPNTSTTLTDHILPLEIKKENPISSTAAKSLTAEQTAVNLARETEDFETNKRQVPSSELLAESEGADELHTNIDGNGNKHGVTSSLPGEVFQVVEKPAHANSPGGIGIQNAAQNIPLLRNANIMKYERDYPRDPLVSDFDVEKPTQLDDTISPPGVVSGSREPIILVTPTLSTPAAVVVDGTISEIPVADDTIVVPVVKEVESDTTNSLSPTIGYFGSDHANQNNDDAPSRVALISKPLGSNQNNPQDEIKVQISTPQDNILPEPSINIPVASANIKEILPTPLSSLQIVPLISTAETVSIPNPTRVVQQRTISSKPTTSINSISTEETLSESNPSNTDPLPVSPNAPTLLQPETSDSVVSSLDPVAPPADINSDGESVKEQTPNKQQQTFTLGENGNQEDLVVSERTQVVAAVDDAVMKKVAAELGDGIEREKEQFSSNQATFHAPTVSQQASHIIGNNSVTFLFADKTV